MSAINYRPDIQGLRAIAVLVVMLFHFNPAWLPGGFVGVDVFLVISGFLIVSILLHKKKQPDYQIINVLKYFYISRLKRITPAYFSMLVLVSLLAAIFFIPQDLAVYKNGLKQAIWFSSNHYFSGFGDYFAPANHEQPLLHTWSLAVEIQFYLLAPLLVLLLPIKALKWVFAVLLLGLTAVAEYRLRILGIQQATYYSLYARLPEFFVGGLVALYINTGKGWHSWYSKLGIVLVLISAVIQPQLGPFPGVPALLPVAGAALVLLSPAQGLASQLLTNKPMVWLGELSYSLYLWHWPVLALLRYCTGSQVLDMPSSLLFLALTLLLATLSFYWVEIPLRVHQIRLKQALGYSVLAGAALVTGSSMARINQALSPPPLPIEYQRYADPATICHGQIVGDCLKGDLNSDKEVLVLGDSHAAMLNLFFDQLGKELGFKARIITASSCVTIPGFDYQRIAEWAHNSRLAQIEYAKPYIEKAEIIFLAAFWNWHFKSQEFENILQNFIENNKAKKYIISQEPLLRVNPMRSYKFSTPYFTAISGINPEYINANNKLKRISCNGKISYLNFQDFSVFKSIPLWEGKIIYYDEHHLNEIGIEQYTREATPIIKNIIQ
ncbi:acyltransferase family protein [Comamonas nitrativorans]|uniref:Acyltransferase family protein n=1 Tax=Comamonas nitrativorans TaxID=108437 RepID=A0ABV9GUJ3_9BURK